MKVRVGLVVVGLLSGMACLSARVQPKRFYVLHGDPRTPVGDGPLIRGLVRVRNLDTDRVYEKFQIVVRRSPYELGYSAKHVWAVKPNEAVSDLLAAALETSATFSAVTRELLDTRPQFVVSGTLHAVEVYDSDDLWFAHLGMSLHLSRFRDGERIWSYDFDQRKEVNSGDFGHAVRALSELLDGAMTRIIEELAALDIASGAPEKRPAPLPPRPEPEPQPDDSAGDVVYVPEDRVMPPPRSD